MSIQYKRVAAGLYTDPKITKFGQQPPHPTTFLLWILTGPALNIVPSCVSIGRYGMAEQSGWTPEEIDMMIRPLIDSGIVQFDAAAPFLYLPNAIKYNEPKSPSNVTSWQSDWRKLPNSVLKERAWHMLKKHCEVRDRGIVFDKKKIRSTKTSFALAFTAIEKPPETDITPSDHRPDHRSDHRPIILDGLNNNNNNNNNSNTAPQNSASIQDSNVHSFKSGGAS